MKKLAGALSGISFLSLASKVFAQVQPNGTTIQIGTPAAGVDPNADVGKVISQIISVVFVFAIVAVLFMFVLGAFAWITSGGEKEAVGKARGRIIAALVGLAVLALSFLIIKVVGVVLNVNLLQLSLPTLGK